MTPPFGTSVTLYRGWGRGGGVFLVATMLALASGCATKGDMRRLQNEVTEQATRQEAQLRELSANIQALQDSLEVQSGIQSEMVVDTRGVLARDLRDIQAQLSQLTQLTGLIQSSMVALSERVMAEGARVTTSDRPADPDSLRALMVRGGGDGAACEDTYEAAVIQLNRGSFGTARAAFGMLLNSCPDHPLAARAQFNLASALEEENRLDQALEEFLRVTELYPAADEVPMALYRIALIHVVQENPNEAVIYLDRVVNTYPDSGAAELAEELLQGLR